MRTRVRFEILKRDRFTCAYCGKHPPDVLLEVDHVVPRAAGGTDEPSNLITSCVDCNRGKADQALSEGLSASVCGRSTSDLRKRLKQAREYAAVQAEIEEFTKEQLDQFWALWTERFCGEYKDGWFRVQCGFPAESRVREMLREAGLQTLLEAIRVTADKFGRRPRGRQTFAYYWAVVRNMNEQRLNP